MPDLLLADFGIARFSSATTTQSQNHNVRGTPMFMAPEQWDGRPVPASDQYALAIMAFRLLAGRFPFQGTMGQIMHHHYMMQPPAPSSLNSQLNATVDGIILHALAKEPGQRFPDILAFADAFTQAIGEPEDLQHVLIALTPTNAGSSAPLSEHELTASLTSIAAKPIDAETLHKATSTANQPAALPTPTPTPVPLNALIPTVKNVVADKHSTPDTGFLVGNDDATFITPTHPANVSLGNDNPTFINVAQTAGTRSFVEKASRTPTILLTPPAPQELAFAASSQLAGAAKRKYSPFQKSLVIILLALVVLAGSGLLIYKNLAFAKSAGIHGQNGAQAHTTFTTLALQTPTGTVTITVISTNTPTTAQTPNPTGSNTPPAGSTTTSGTTSSATPTATSAATAAPKPTATSVPQPTATAVPKPTATPVPRPTPTTPPPGCSVSSWSSNLRTQSDGGTVFHVTNYCQRTVYLRFTQKPTYTTDLQVCFGSNCSGWNSTPSSNIGTYIEFFSSVSVGGGFTVNARCHGGAICPAAYTVYGDVKY